MTVKPGKKSEDVRVLDHSHAFRRRAPAKPETMILSGVKRKEKKKKKRHS